MARKRLIPDPTIFDAILDAFQTGGEKAVSFRLIAARTGLSGAALVGRFGSVEAMLHAAIGHAWDQLEAELGQMTGIARKPGEGRHGAALILLKGLRHPHPAVLAASLADAALAQRADGWRQAVVDRIAVQTGDTETAQIVFAAWSARHNWQAAGGKGFRLGAMLRRLG